MCATKMIHLDTPTLHNVLNKVDFMASPGTMMQEGFFTFSEADLIKSAEGSQETTTTLTEMTSSRTMTTTTTTTAPAAPVTRQMSDNTLFHTVLSHAFIPEQDMEAIMDIDDGEGGGGTTHGGTTGISGGCVGDAPCARNTQRASPMTNVPAAVRSAPELTSMLAMPLAPQQQPLNKRTHKALLKKESMTQSQYAKYSAYRGKNNDSVARSRQKKRQKLAESEARCEELEQDKAELHDRIGKLESEVKSLMALLIKNTAIA